MAKTVMSNNINKVKRRHWYQLHMSIIAIHILLVSFPQHIPAYASFRCPSSKCFCKILHNSSADIRCGSSVHSAAPHSVKWRQLAGVSNFGVSAFKRAILFFTSLSIDSDISSLNPEVWKKSMHLSGLSLASKTLEPRSSFWGQVGHLPTMWCHQSGSGNIFFAWSSD